MRLDPRTIMELLQRLERQCAEHRPYLAKAALAISRNDFELAVEAAGSLHGVLESIIVTRTRLRDYILVADGLGEPECLIELAIRARRVVIAMQSSRLRDLFTAPGATERARGWFTGKFRRFEDVAACLDELIKSSCTWECYLVGQPLPAGMKEADRAAMYRTTVQIAQRSMRRLGADPDLVHFLKSGIATVDWLDAYSGCKQIASALVGQIDVESEGSVADLTSYPASATPAGRAGDGRNR
jgi:hypothetical protein